MCVFDIYSAVSLLSTYLERARRVWQRVWSGEEGGWGMGVGGSGLQTTIACFRSGLQLFTLVRMWK